jgi:hypothetical protein
MQEYLKMSKYFEYLSPKVDEVLYDRGNEYVWKTTDGIICSVPKEVQVLYSVAEQKINLIEFLELFGKEKKFMVSVINPHRKNHKETRDYKAAILPEIIHSLAVINQSSLGRMAINLFIGMRPPTYNLKVFPDAKTGFEWIRSIKNEES